MSDVKPDLAFVTTDELVSELMDRHLNLLVIRENPTKEAEKHQNNTCCDYSGSMNACIGMAERAKFWLLKRAGNSLDGE